MAAPRGNQTRGWSEEAKCYSRVAQKSAGRWASAQKHVRARRPRVSRGANVCRPVSWTFRDIPKQAPWESNSRHAQSLQGSATVGKRDLQYHLQKRTCSAVSCRVVQCRAMSCHVVPCRAMSWRAQRKAGGLSSFLWRLFGVIRGSTCLFLDYPLLVPATWQNVF